MKISTHKLMTLDFWRICISNCFLYLAVYLILPLLPWLSVLYVEDDFNAAWVYLLLALGMIVVGPFHAWLGDTFKRKYVLMLSTLSVGLCIGGLMLSNNAQQYYLLCLSIGFSFGIATTAGITVSIDITESHRRSPGNRMYALSGMLGMLFGCFADMLVAALFGVQALFYVAMICIVISLIADAGIYVAFRAPVGVSKLNLDRFFLPLAWLPALNVAAGSFSVGIMTYHLLSHIGGWILTPLLVIFIVPLTKMFVKLSHHQQRGTANTTLQLAIQTGWLFGMAFSVWTFELEYALAACAISLSVAVFTYIIVTLPYFRKNRVRP